MTTYQTRAAAEIAADHAERHSELSLRERLIADQQARELRAENARRMSAAMAA